ncbi:hypothetical protein C0995_011644 [Termitomyces sp. Mi166|nr:hypothetical protein C0995_011644 [Termitomyces sp. Mi166\
MGKGNVSILEKYDSCQMQTHCPAPKTWKICVQEEAEDEAEGEAEAGDDIHNNNTGNEVDKLEADEPSGDA